MQVSTPAYGAHSPKIDATGLQAGFANERAKLRGYRVRSGTPVRSLSVFAMGTFRASRRWRGILKGAAGRADNEAAPQREPSFSASRLVAVVSGRNPGSNDIFRPVTYPLRASRATAFGSRAAGSPQPAPPALKFTNRSPFRSVVRYMPTRFSRSSPGHSTMWFRIGDGPPPSSPHPLVLDFFFMDITSVSAVARTCRRTPSPPRYRPAPPESGTRLRPSWNRLDWRSSTSIGVFRTVLVEGC